LESLAPEIFGSASVALTIGALHWVVSSKGSLLPKMQDGNSEYRIKLPWRVAGTVGGALPLVLLIWSWLSESGGPDFVFIGIAALFVAIGVWLNMGSVAPALR
jgi:hypothetical protein